jgi:hypothetical protein
MVWRPANDKPLHILFDVSKSPDFMDILAFLSEYKALTDYHFLKSNAYLVLHTIYKY